MIKKILLGIIMAVSLSVFMTACGGRESSEDKFIVGLDDSFPPMGFRDESGEIVGFDIDLARAVAEEMGMEVEFRAVDWDGVILSLKKGDIDLIWNGLTVTPEREEEINFTSPYLANKQVLIVAKESDIEDKGDLEGGVLGIQMGSSSEKALEADGDFNDSLADVRKYGNNTEALMDLASGRVDVVLVDEIVGRYYMSLREGQYRVLPEFLEKEDYAVGVRKEDEEFLEKLEEALNKVKNSEIGVSISKEWFEEDILVK